MAKYPEKFLLKLPEGTLGRIDAASGNRSEFVRLAIEAALGDDQKKNSIVAPVKDLQNAPQIIPENIPEPSLRDRDKDLLLSLIRGKSLNSRSARVALGLPGLRYDNAEKALLRDGAVRMVDGCLEVTDT